MIYFIQTLWTKIIRMCQMTIENEVSVKIEQLKEEEWINFKTIVGNSAWENAIKEVIKLNTEKKAKYRAVCENRDLTYIYCSGIYIVPTIRNW